MHKRLIELGMALKRFINVNMTSFKTKTSHTNQIFYCCVCSFIAEREICQIRLNCSMPVVNVRLYLY